MSGETSNPGGSATGDGKPADPPTTDDPADGAVRGAYTWREFMHEHGHGDESESVYATRRDSLLPGLPFVGSTKTPGPDDWDRVDFDPAAYLGQSPEEFHDGLEAAVDTAARFSRAFADVVEVGARKDEYSWEDYKREYFLDDDGQAPTAADGSTLEFDPEKHLGFDPHEVEDRLGDCATTAARLREIEGARTVNVNPDLDEDEFFSTPEGATTLVNRYDLEKAVPMAKKRHFVEEQRYWVDRPYAFVIIFHSIKENETKYYVVDPYLTPIEEDLIEFFAGKLRTSIKHSDDDVVVRGSDSDRAGLLQEETEWLMDRYNLRNPEEATAEGGRLLPALGLADMLGVGSGSGLRASLGGAASRLGLESRSDRGGPDSDSLAGLSARPEPAVLEGNPGWLTEYQVEKLLYIIQRDFIGYERIDPIKHDINVEDISCDGYDSPVFVYHTDHENLITNITHGKGQLDNFVIKLAQRSGKGISKRTPQIDATLPDGSRAQLTLGNEVSDHGTNYTIRQFKDVPFTPVDLIAWKTFSLDEMAFLWLCIESNKSLIFAGGTASGKTTSLNAVSLFIPSNAKIVSIEDTREVELPQRNWVASVTRPSFSQDNAGEVDEFDLLEAALRQRPDYIVMGEVRGEEGRTLFQVMSTGHTTYTTFHADTVDEVLKRFTTDPINVSKTLFTALDLIAVQTQTKVQGKKVRRSKTITEINDYDSKNDEISVQDIYQWQPEEDEFLQHGTPETMETIAFDRGWSQQQLAEELFERRTILAYLITNGLNAYTEVAATLQAFINDPETILSLIANEQLADCLADLREMESVHIDIDPQKEAMVPRPEPGQDVLDEAEEILARADEHVFEQYRGQHVGSLLDALSQTSRAEDVVAMPGMGNGLQSALPETTEADAVVGASPAGDGSTHHGGPLQRRTNGDGDVESNPVDATDVESDPVDATDVESNPVDATDVEPAGKSEPTNDQEES